MATKQQIISRAREIIINNPTAGKERVNQKLRAEFGVGLRSATILQIKQVVATEHPSLYPELYAAGSVPRGLNEIYRGWLKSGFMAFEARELTLGHGERYRAFDARAVFDSAPAQAARQTRINWVRDLLRQGWTKQQIRQNIIDFYLKSKRVDVWRHIRAEYKPHKKVDYREYEAKARKRAKSSQKRLLRPSKSGSAKPYTKEEWIAQLKRTMNSTTNPELRDRYRRQILNLGGTV